MQLSKPNRTSTRCKSTGHSKRGSPQNELSSMGRHSLNTNERTILRGSCGPAGCQTYRRIYACPNRTGRKFAKRKRQFHASGSFNWRSSTERLFDFLELFGTLRRSLMWAQNGIKPTKGSLFLPESPCNWVASKISISWHTSHVCRWPQILWAQMHSQSRVSDGMLPKCAM